MDQQELEDRIAGLVTKAFEAGLLREVILMALETATAEFQEEEDR